MQVIFLRRDFLAVRIYLTVIFLFAITGCFAANVFDLTFQVSKLLCILHQ